MKFSLIILASIASSQVAAETANLRATNALASSLGDLDLCYQGCNEDSLNKKASADDDIEDDLNECYDACTLSEDAAQTRSSLGPEGVSELRDCTSGCAKDAENDVEKKLKKEDKKVDKERENCKDECEESFNDLMLGKDEKDDKKKDDKKEDDKKEDDKKEDDKKEDDKKKDDDDEDDEKERKKEEKDCKKKCDKDYDKDEDKAEEKALKDAQKSANKCTTKCTSVSVFHENVVAAARA